MPAENISSADSGLGNARAGAIRDYMVSLGIPADRIETGGEQSEVVTKTGLFVCNALACKLIRVELPKPGTLELLFPTALAKTEMTTEQKALADEIKAYLDKFPASSLGITGYTDNTGTRAANLALGKKRAEFAMSVFSGMGVPGSRMECSSLGPDDPVADNTSPEGRAKNRRAIVKIK